MSARDVEIVTTTVGRLAVRVIGSGPPVVLWHSMFVDSRSWDRVAAELSGDRKLVLIDGPSFGDSDDLTRTSSIRECADAAAEIMEYLQLPRVDWVGNAWGGHVGIALGAARSDLINTLCAIGAPTHRLSGFERVQVVSLRPIVRAFGFLPFVTNILAAALLNDQTRATDPEAVEITTSGFRNVDRHSFDLAVRSFVLSRPDLSLEARSLTMPTLFAVGDDRGELTPDQARAAAAAMHDAEVVTLPGARGIAPLENPSSVIATLRTFWAAHPLV